MFLALDTLQRCVYLAQNIQIKITNHKLPAVSSKVTKVSSTRLELQPHLIANSKHWSWSRVRFLSLTHALGYKLFSPNSKILIKFLRFKFKELNTVKKKRALRCHKPHLPTFHFGAPGAAILVNALK